jgi:hypothetical protein
VRSADQLIVDIVRSSRISSRKRRQELLRELATHVDDFVLLARQAGRGDEEIQRLLVANFGDPQQIAQQFAGVYRRERILFHLSVFLISTLVLTTLVSAAVMSMQAGMALSFGVPVLRLLGSRHSLIEALDILATVTAYMGLISLEKLFDRRRVVRALAVLAASWSVLFAVFAATGMPKQFLIFGFVNAVFLWTVQVCISRSAARLAVVFAGFGVLGATFFHPSASAVPAALALSTGSWMLMGAAYQAMTQLAARVDGALLNRFQRL